MEEKLSKLWTYRDYQNLYSDEKVEIIEGIVYNMSPAPSSVHQRIAMDLGTIINNYLITTNKPCSIFRMLFWWKKDRMKVNLEMLCSLI